MNIRKAVTAATLVLVTCGCAEAATAERPQTGRITVDGNTHTTQSISCSQVGWLMTIEANADPGQARVFLRLGGETPTVETVSITNFDGFNGVTREPAEASVVGGTYTVGGTAEGQTLDSPATPKTVPFEIEAPC